MESTGPPTQPPAIDQDTDWQETSGPPEEAEEIDVGSLTLLDPNESLVAVDRASIDIQISTAKSYPRSITTSIHEAETLASLDAETAGSCFYSLPTRGNKQIEGPSARLAEIMAYAWGNLRVDADIVAEDLTHVTAMGTCFDLERNVAVRVRVKRRITRGDGTRFSEDMIGITCNAAISIAFRNCVFKVIPAGYVRRVYYVARSASLGGGTMDDKRTKALKWFADVGVREQSVYDLLEINGRDDLGEDEIITLRGLVTAIKDGDTTVAQAFGQHEVSYGVAGTDSAPPDPLIQPTGQVDYMKDTVKAPLAAPSGDQPTESISQLEELAGVGKADREAICKQLGIKSSVDDPDAYCEHLKGLIAHQQEVEA